MPHRSFKALSQSLMRFRQSRRGSAAIEFAFVAPIYFAVLLAAFQISVVFIAQAYLETVAEAGARLVTTNQANTLTQAQFARAICGKVSALFNCNNMIVALQPAPTSANLIAAAMPQFNSSGQLIGTTNFTIPPQPWTTPPKMILVVMYQWPVIGAPLGFNIGNLGNGTYLMVCTQVFQVEPPTT